MESGFLRKQSDSLDKPVLDRLADGLPGSSAHTPLQTNRVSDGIDVADGGQELSDTGEEVEDQVEEAGNVSITISTIDATNTPAGVGERIPPRAATAVTVTVTGWTPPMAPIVLSMEGGGAANGNATIDGGATAEIQSSGQVTLRGTVQTSPGNAGNLKLVGHLGGTKVGTSNGFTVCAIPETVTVSFSSLITGPKRGIAMTTNNDSDSGNVADLDKVEMSELVQYVNGSGCFNGITSGSNSGYLAANNTPHGVDSHSTPVGLASAAGEIDSEQGFVFKDERSGVSDIPVKNSGFNINREVFDDSGTLKITTSKAPWAGTVRGATVSNGSGSASRTQVV